MCRARARRAADIMSNIIRCLLTRWRRDARHEIIKLPRKSSGETKLPRTNERRKFTSSIRVWGRYREFQGRRRSRLQRWKKRWVIGWVNSPRGHDAESRNLACLFFDMSAVSALFLRASSRDGLNQSERLAAIFAAAF